MRRRTRSSTETPAPIEAKGKAEPVPVWEAVAPRARLGVDVDRGPATRLVGREGELALLTGALARVRGEREPQLVTLVGVPGIGKSRLVAELLAAVDADPDLITWRQGRCLPYGEGVAFWALGEMVKAQAGVFEEDSAEVAEAKLREALASLIETPAEADWVAGHLRPLLGLVGVRGRPPTAAARRSPPGAASSRRSASSGPTVLVFEDLHWADDGLLDFVDHLADWATGVPLLDRRHGPPGAARTPARLGRRQGEQRHRVALAALGHADRAPRRPAARALAPAGGDAVGAARPRGRQPALRRGVRAHAGGRALHGRRAAGDGAGDHRRAAGRCSAPTRRR